MLTIFISALGHEVEDKKAASPAEVHTMWKVSTSDMAMGRDGNGNSNHHSHTRPVTKGGPRGAGPPLNPSSPPLEDEIVQWPSPLVNRLSGLLGEIELVVGCSVGFKNAKCVGGQGLRPGPNWGSSCTTLSQTSCSGADGRWGQGAMSLQTTDKN